MNYSEISKVITGESLRSKLEPKLPNEGSWIEHQSYSKSDIPPVLYGEEKGHNTPEKWAEYRAKKLEENYCGSDRIDLGVRAKAEKNTIYVYRNIKQRIYHMILKGEVQDSSDLRISENQFYDDEPKYSKKYGDYYTGLIVKITGDYNPELRGYHNQLAKISVIIDAYHYLVRTECKNRLKIRDTDVKSWTCTESDDPNLISNKN